MSVASGVHSSCVGHVGVEPLHALVGLFEAAEQLVELGDHRLKFFRLGRAVQTPVQRVSGKTACLIDELAQRAQTQAHQHKAAHRYDPCSGQRRGQQRQANAPQQRRIVANVQGQGRDQCLGCGHRGGQLELQAAGFAARQRRCRAAVEHGAVGPFESQRQVLVSNEEVIELVRQRCHIAVPSGFDEQMLQLGLLVAQRLGLTVLQAELRGCVDRSADHEQPRQALQCQPIGQTLAQ